MTVTAFLKETNKNSKPSRKVTKQSLRITLDLLEDKFVSTFNRVNGLTQRKFYKGLLERLLADTKYLYITAIIPKSVRLIYEGIHKKDKDFNPFIENVDWTRGRFIGRVEKIVIKDMQITEQVYRTTKGGVIIVKRSELGLINRLLLF